MLLNHLVLLFILNIGTHGEFVNNACNDFKDYVNVATSKNCFYNPDMILEAPEIIEKYIGTVESYEVTTEDGYILTIFRIPKRNPKGIILFQHPLATNSKAWVSQGNDSLPFCLWYAGYEIWLNNNRGTTFSEKHLNLTIHDTTYWDFSFHEIGLYDVPSEIQIIREKTNNSKILFIGHSMGTTVGLIYSSLKPVEAKNFIKTFVFISVPCYFNYSTSLLAAMPKLRSLTKASHYLKARSFFMELHLTPNDLAVVLKSFPRIIYIARWFVSALVGGIPNEEDPVLLNLDCPLILKDFSVKILMHFLQLIKAKTRFQMFDYGRKKNLEIYNSPIPPVYPLENILVPILIISSSHDSLTTLKDADVLIERLPKNIRKDHIKISNFSHIDYFIGKHRIEMVYVKLLNFLKKFQRNKK